MGTLDGVVTITTFLALLLYEIKPLFRLHN